MKVIMKTNTGMALAALLAITLPQASFAQVSAPTTKAGAVAASGASTSTKATASNPATSSQNPDVRSGAKEGVSETIGTPKPRGQSEFSTRPFVAPDSSKIIK